MYIHDGIRAIHPKEDYVDFLRRHKFQSYYQWVPFFLFFLSVCTYAPYYFWKCMEGGCIGSFVDDSKPADNCPSNRILKQDGRNKKVRLDCDKLVDVVVGERDEHSNFSTRFGFVHFLAVISILFQLFFTDYFLHGDWLKYGSAVLGMQTMYAYEVMTGGNGGISHYDISNPMPFVFPRMGKCQLEYFSVVGLPQSIDGICILSLNIINEKIFIFIWVAFMLLLTLASFQLLLLALLSTFARLRPYVMWFSMPRGVHLDLLKAICNELNFGDWIILRSVLQTLDAKSRLKFIASLTVQLKQGVNSGRRFTNAGNVTATTSSTTHQQMNNFNSFQNSTSTDTPHSTSRATEEAFFKKTPGPFFIHPSAKGVKPTLSSDNYGGVPVRKMSTFGQHPTIFCAESMSDKHSAATGGPSITKLNNTNNNTNNNNNVSKELANMAAMKRRMMEMYV